MLVPPHLRTGRLPGIIWSGMVAALPKLRRLRTTRAEPDRYVLWNGVAPAPQINFSVVFSRALIACIGLKNPCTAVRLDLPVWPFCKELAYKPYRSYKTRSVRQ